MRGPVLVAALLLGAGLAGCMGVVNDAPLTPGGAARSWPPMEDAEVRPGIQIKENPLFTPVNGGGTCTSNFVFTGPVSGAVYLGTAAHCTHALDIGDVVMIGGGVANGTLHYNSWHHLNAGASEEEACTTERGRINPERCKNDFSLIRIHDADAHKVHPAVRHFGGPTALADAAAVDVGDKVLTYGRSAGRLHVEPTSWKEGYVGGQDLPWVTYVDTVTPGIPGDSGSPVMTADGEALGVVVTLRPPLPGTGSNGVTNLDAALAYAFEEAGVLVRLATWDLLDEGVLPGRS